MANAVRLTRSARTLVPRPLRARAGRALAAVRSWVPPLPLAGLRDLRARAKRLSRATFEVASDRWPRLSRLVPRGPGSGTAPGAAVSSGAAPALDAQASPAPPAGGLERLEDHVSALRSPSAEIAVRAALSLGAFGAAAVSPLQDALENLDGFFHPAVRAAALQALSSLLPLEDGEVFADAAADTDVEVSLAAIHALVTRNDPLAVEVLLAVVENLSGFYVHETRLAAAVGLRRLGVTGTSILGDLCNAESNLEIRAALSPLS